MGCICHQKAHAVTTHNASVIYPQLMTPQRLPISCAMVDYANAYRVKIIESNYNKTLNKNELFNDLNAPNLLIIF